MAAIHDLINGRSILLTTEGTYPHYHGGVSVWCDQLVHSLAEFDFYCLSVVHSPTQPMLFKPAGNLRQVIAVAQWGTEEPGARDEPFSFTYRRRAATTARHLEARFLPVFQAALREILAGEDARPEVLGSALVMMRRYFQQHDYMTAFASPATWACFLEEMKLFPAGRPTLTLEQATLCLRWLTRLLSVLVARIPNTDLVHASMAGTAGLPGVIQKLEHGTPYVLTEHGVYLREVYLAMARSPHPEGCRRFLFSLYRAIAKVNYFFADAVTILGQFNGRWQVRFGARPEQLVFTPNGVDPRRFRPGEVLPPRPTILTLARIYPLKGIDVLLKAAGRVRTRVPDVRVRILGEVADKKYFERCQRIVEQNHLKGNVEFATTNKPEQEYQAAHVYCLPSISEAMPFVVLEAMLSGVPVVATDVGNVSEVLSGTGLLARPADPEHLAEQLLSMLDGDQAAARRRDFAARGRERALRIYTIDRAMDNFRELYANLINHGSLAGLSTATGLADPAGTEEPWTPEFQTA
jgi:glycosyltransferase involved in cell wall biosynthesis